MISRIFPSNTSLAIERIPSKFCCKNICDALARASGSESILIFATPSTKILINSLVGTALDVLISTCIKLSGILSTLSNPGNLNPARPINTLCLNGPVIIKAVSGGAFTYDTPIKMSTMSTMAAIII